MKRSPHPDRNRGSALVAVIITFTLVAAALTALAILFNTEAKRTKATVAGVQLRQLLLAATPSATEELNAHGNATRDVQLKAPVDGATLVLKITAKSPTTAQVTVTATTSGASLSQSLTYANTNSQWTLHAATLSSGQWSVASGQHVE
jgi:hypothetical protein